MKNDIVRLSCGTNDSRFREGDLIILHRDNPRDPEALHCELQYDGETDLEVSVIKGNEYFLTLQSNNWVIDQDWYDASPFYLDALNGVADSQLGRSIILLPSLRNPSAITSSRPFDFNLYRMNLVNVFTGFSNTVMF